MYRLYLIPIALMMGIFLSPLALEMFFPARKLVPPVAGVVMVISLLCAMYFAAFIDRGRNAEEADAKAAVPKEELPPESS